MSATEQNHLQSNAYNRANIAREESYVTLCFSLSNGILCPSADGDQLHLHPEPLGVSKKNQQLLEPGFLIRLFVYLEQVWQHFRLKYGRLQNLNFLTRGQYETCRSSTHWLWELAALLAKELHGPSHVATAGGLLDLEHEFDWRFDRWKTHTTLRRLIPRPQSTEH